MSFPFEMILFHKAILDCPISNRPLHLYLLTYLNIFHSIITVWNDIACLCFVFYSPDHGFLLHHFNPSSEAVPNKLAFVIS